MGGADRSVVLRSWNGAVIPSKQVSALPAKRGGTQVPGLQERCRRRQGKLSTFPREDPADGSRARFVPKVRVPWTARGRGGEVPDRSFKAPSSVAKKDRPTNGDFCE